MRSLFSDERILLVIGTILGAFLLGLGWDMGKAFIGIPGFCLAMFCMMSAIVKFVD